MNYKTVVPALVVGLSLSSGAMAKKLDDGVKNTRLVKAEKQIRHAKVKRAKKAAVR